MKFTAHFEIFQPNCRARDKERYNINGENTRAYVTTAVTFNGRYMQARFPSGSVGKESACSAGVPG